MGEFFTEVTERIRYEGPDSDNPLAPVNGSWVTPEARAGAAAFVAFTRTPKAEAKVVVAGLEPDGKPVDLASPTNRSAAAALDQWAIGRKRARVLLLFDVSDSMGDPSDPRDPDSAAKIDLAKRAAVASLSQLAPDDQVGLRIFTTRLGPASDRNWVDVVPIGRLDRQRAALTRAINALEPLRGSPLYLATRDGFDAMTAHSPGGTSAMTSRIGRGVFSTTRWRTANVFGARNVDE